MSNILDGPHQALKAAIDKANAALEGENVEAMKTADPNPTPRPQGKPQVGLPQTGDIATLLATGAAGAGDTLAALGAIARKRCPNVSFGV